MANKAAKKAVKKVAKKVTKKKVKKPPVKTAEKTKAQQQAEDNAKAQASAREKAKATAKSREANSVGDVEAEEEYLEAELAFRKLVKRNGGLRKGLTDDQETEAEGLKEVLDRSGFFWDMDVIIPGYPNEQLNS